MECNKDDAVRAKELAEKKFIEKDYSSAKKFAFKAQSLYPKLEGLSQMCTVLDVHVAAETKINGEVDWYGILGVTPFADDEMIKKHYRKLALILHPDKNKALGAEGAFKLVSEAWSLLSVEAKRQAYNYKRNLKGVQHKVPSRTEVPSVQPSANGYQNAKSSVASNSKAQRGPISSPSYPKPATFWTICNHCTTHYQYLRIYLNHILLCPGCKKAFKAVENTSPPVGKSRTSSGQKHQSSRHHAASGPNSSNNTGHTADPAANVVQQASDKVKKDQERRQSIAEWERNQRLMGNPSLKKRRKDDNHLNGDEGNLANQKANGNDGADLEGASESSTGNVGTKRIYGFSSIYDRANGTREVSYPEMQKILIAKAQSEVCEMLKKRASAAETEKARKDQEKMKANEKQKSVGHVETAEDSSTDEEAKPAMSINVPDPDFHNFDLDRTESSFGEDQVWAAYDNDGMPRFYARIHKVISLKPFKMRISWLNSRSNGELGPLNWVGSGFPKTCGQFMTGRHETFKTLNSFSNKVSWTKSSRGVVRIFPSRGSVWALYRNWSPDWNQDTSAAVRDQYDMVEVVGDFTEEQGVSVVPLSKVAGFKTVFRKRMDPKEVRRIPKEEMFRFSHQVPSYLLTGEEADNAPKGCWELDPAAMPSELLQVMREADEGRVAVNVGVTKEEMVQSASTREVEGGMRNEEFQKPFTTENDAYQVLKGN